MFSELMMAGKYFLQLHRRWLLLFVRDEALLLIIGLIGLYFVRTSLIVELKHLNLVWLFVIPPCLAQIKLATYLGITFSSKSVAAWETRLPFSRSRACLWSYLMIGFNALFLFIPLAPAWTLFFEMTGCPIAIVLFLIPCLAFQATRRSRTEVSGTALSVAVSVTLTLLTATILILAPLDEASRFYKLAFVQINPVLDLNVLFLGISLVVALIVDQSRAKFTSLILSVSIGTCIFFGIETLRRVQFQESEYYSKAKALEGRSLSQAKECKEFGERFYHSPILEEQRANNRERFSQEDVLADQYFNTGTQLFQALKEIKTFPGWPYTRKEVIQLWEGLPFQPATHEMASVLLRINSCSDVQLFNFMIRMIQGVSLRGSKATDLKLSERKFLQEGLWDITTQMMDHSVSLIQALLSMDLIRKMVDYQLVEGFPSDKLSEISDVLQEIKNNAKHRVRSFSQLRVPTNGRLRSEFKELMSDEVRATSKIMDQLIGLSKKAKLREF